MPNEQDDTDIQNSDDIELEAEDGGKASESEKSPKKQFTDEEKLNHHLGIANRLQKKLGIDKKVEPESTNKDKSDGQTVTKDPDDLLEKAYLRSAQITDADEVELALTTAKKWGVSIDQLVDDEDFKLKLVKLRTKKSNDLATSNIKGNRASGQSQAKNTPEYWIAKGLPPTAEDVPDRKVRAKIARAMMESTKSTKKFYND